MANSFTKRKPPVIITPKHRQEDRPGAVGRDAHGWPLYAPVELKAYRELAGISNSELATALDTSQMSVSRAESDDSEVQEPQAVAFLDGCDAITMRRATIVSRGRLLFASLADGTYVPKKSAMTVHTAAESDALLSAQGRNDS